MPSAPSPTIGTLLAERYRLEHRIAAGGMGEVWRAVDVVLGRTVAVKLLRAELADDDLFRERLRREARAAGGISHPGVVPVFDYGEVTREDTSDLAFLVMEHVDGRSLAAELSEHGALGVERTLLIVEQTAAALQAAHDVGVVHRDIKPGNILVGPTGDVKIADFGIARAGDATSLTRTGTLTGTAHYLSPEQASGKPATASSDIYALGIVAYACLTGDVPFSEGNGLSIALAQLHTAPPPLPADIPVEVADLVMGMLEKEPARRPSSADAVAVAAHRLRQAPPAATAVHPFSAPTRVDPGPATRVAMPSVAANPRRRLVPLVALCAAAAVLVAVLVTAFQSDSTHVPAAVGKQESVAAAQLRDAGLLIRVKRVDAAGKSEGIVLEQSTPAGTEVADGSTVTLTVASGNVRVPVDDLLGATLERAEQILADLGLNASTVDQFSGSVPGTILAVDPHDLAENGSTVELTVAFGRGSDSDKGDDEDKEGKEKGRKGKDDDD